MYYTATAAQYYNSKLMNKSIPTILGVDSN